MTFNKNEYVHDMMQLRPIEVVWFSKWSIRSFYEKIVDTKRYYEIVPREPVQKIDTKNMGLKNNKTELSAFTLDIIIKDPITRIEV